jgi:hypothetical protein
LKDVEEILGLLLGKKKPKEELKGDKDILKKSVKEDKKEEGDTKKKAPEGFQLQEEGAYITVIT